jgi:hypothetical protein
MLQTEIKVNWYIFFESYLHIHRTALSKTFSTNKLVFVACGGNCEALSMYPRDHLSRRSVGLLIRLTFRKPCSAKRRHEFHEKLRNKYIKFWNF